MWEKIRRFIFFRQAYLEDELARTREELHRWQDALLVARGATPLTPRAEKALPATKARLLPSQWKARAEQFTRKKEKKDGEETPAA